MEEDGQGRKFMNDKENQEILVSEGKVFFDSNILIYSVDEKDSRKNEIAMKLLSNASISKNGIISTQSLQEFYNVATKKLKLSSKVAKNYVELFSKQFYVTEISVPLILDAIDISIKTQFSFWDSLILSTANDSGCIIVYSEDLNNGQIVNGSKVLNPFGAKVA